MENNQKPVYKRPVDEYLSCDQYNGGEGFIKFFKEDEKRYYFAFNGPNNKTYLRSQGYQNEPGRDNGIDSVIRNSPLDERWSTGYDDEENYHYYVLIAGNRQEIARSCRYETKEEMEKDYAWVRGEESTIGIGAQLIDGVWHSAKQLSYKRNIDEYLPCDEYEGETGFHKFQKDGEYYFAFNGEDNKTYLRSEGYTNEQGRDNGIDSVIRNSPLEERWVKGYDEENKYHYYALKAGNRQEIARSCEYDSEAAMLAAFAIVRGENSLIGAGSKLVDGKLMSAAMLGAASLASSGIATGAGTPEIPPVEPAAAAASIPPAVEENKKGCGRWIPWLLLLLLLIILCFIFCRGCDDATKMVDTPSSVVEKVDESVTVVGDAASGIVEETVEVTTDAADGISDVVENTGGIVESTSDKIAAAIASGESFIIDGLNFKYNSDELTKESLEKLEEAKEIISNHPEIKIEVQGYSDNKGNDAYNKNLSEQRAKSIVNYFVANGIEASRLTAVGYGEEKPIASNDTAEGRAKNRRIEFKIIK